MLFPRLPILHVISTKKVGVKTLDLGPFHSL